MAAIIYISKELIKAEEGTMPITTGLLDDRCVADEDIRIEGVTRITAGYNLIYVEYQTEQDQLNRIRAFGRKEFQSLLVWGEDTAVLLPLQGDLFERQTFRFAPFDAESDEF